MPRDSYPPLVHRILCGRELRGLRENAGLRQDDVPMLFAERQRRMSQSKLNNIERANSAVNKEDLELLLELYRADPRRAEECRRLAIAGRAARRDRNLLRNRFDGDMRLVVDLEETASTVWCHNSMTIPGLLQTEDFMRMLFRAHQSDPDPAAIEAWVEMRLARQRFLDDSGRQFCFIIHEAALCSMRSSAVSRETVAAQVSALCEGGDRPNVEVRAMTFSKGCYPGREETSAIFGFSEDPVVEVTYVETYDGTDVLHDEKDLVRFRSAREFQRAHALDPDRTRSFLRELGPR